MIESKSRAQYGSIDTSNTVSQDNLLDYKKGEAQGEDLLDQSVDSGRDSLEEVVIEYERVLHEDSGLKLGCNVDDLFDVGITDSQVERATGYTTF